MIETLSVSLSGSAFSFLLYENLKSNFFQEGFLIGDFIEKESKIITDNDQQQVHISRTIRIHSALPSPQPFYFYDGIGKIDSDKIKNFLGDSAAKIVAWYKYKPFSTFNCTFREKLIHKQLANLFNLPPEFFSCCLLISESSENSATHSFTQAFVRYHNNSYEQLPLHIVNLSDANYMYKSPEQVSDTFLSIVEGLKIDHKKTHGLQIITKIQIALQKHTEKVVEELSKEEKRLFKLESEIQQLMDGVINKDLTSASNNQVNDVQMNTDSDVSPFNSPKKNSSPKVKRNSQSGKKALAESGREIVTRSKKKV